MDFIAPQILLDADMVSNLGHQERLADFGRSGEFTISSLIPRPEAGSGYTIFSSLRD